MGRGINAGIWSKVFIHSYCNLTHLTTIEPITCIRWFLKREFFNEPYIISTREKFKIFPDLWNVSPDTLNSHPIYLFLNHALILWIYLFQKCIFEESSVIHLWNLLNEKNGFREKEFYRKMWRSKGWHTYTSVNDNRLQHYSQTRTLVDLFKLCMAINQSLWCNTS